MGELSASAMGLASTASALQAFEVAMNAQAGTLKKALDVEAQAVMQLLSSLEVGQNLDLLA